MDVSGDGSLSSIEPALFDLVAFLRGRMRQSRSEVVCCLAELIRGETRAPQELLLLAMHELRLPEVLDAARDWSASTARGSRAECDAAQLFHELADAFRTDWPDRDLYEKHRSHKQDGL
jgi:hypothetical protein